MRRTLDIQGLVIFGVALRASDEILLFDEIQMCALRRSRGFTLIEMLVVLLIMGLFVGLVSSITQPDDRALLHLESERLARLLDLAATKSHLTGKPVAWSADAASYRFWQFNEDTSWT